MQSTKVNVVYQKEPESEPLYINGAYGGFTPQGELLIQFYLEKFSMHEKAELYVSKDGSILEESLDDESSYVIRRVQTSVILNPSFLKVFHEWLGEKIEEYEMIKKNKDEQSEL